MPQLAPPVAQVGSNGPKRHMRVAPSPSMKAKLRKQLRGARRALSPDQHRVRSLMASKAVMRLRRFAAGKRIALYLPFDGEVDTRLLIKAAKQRGLVVYVPVISDLRHSRMRFYPLSGALAAATFGILAPRRQRAAILPHWL